MKHGVLELKDKTIRILCIIAMFIILVSQFGLLDGYVLTWGWYCSVQLRCMFIYRDRNSVIDKRFILKVCFYGIMTVLFLIYLSYAIQKRRVV